MNRKERESAAWFAAFNDLTVALQPTWSGRICWDTATHLRNLGHSPEQAAKMYTYDSSKESGPQDRNAVELP